MNCHFLNLLHWVTHALWEPAESLYSRSSAPHPLIRVMRLLLAITTVQNSGKLYILAACKLLSPEYKMRELFLAQSGPRLGNLKSF